MKIAVIVLTLVALSCSSPQPRKDFHEHFLDMVDVIVEYTVEEILNLFEQYLQYPEFLGTLDYVLSTNFRDILYEIEALPEFIAVADYLENNNIDIHYFIDLVNEAFESGRQILATRNTRAVPSGRNVSAYMADCINLFPKERLAALFEEKKAEDEAFRTAMENLYSDEWDQVLSALFENETFQKKVNTLADNGYDVQMMLLQIKAVFGQN